MVVNSGNRPMVNGTLNEFPVVFDVHSNADFYMQISHKAADSARIEDRIHIDSFGISSPGQVSSLGRDSAFVNTLTVGKATFVRAPASVFETPSDYNHGMLGLRWLTGNHAVVDFAKNNVIINPTKSSSQARREALLASGYVAIPMQRSAKDDRYYILVTLNGVTQPMVVSTVASNTLDTEFAKRAKIKSIATGETYGGPTGTTGQVYEVNQPVRLQVGAASLLIKQAIVEDIYAYSAMKREKKQADQTAGMLAADFLITNGAVVDFGAKTLFVKPGK
ncbi:hypothetical protein [Spirosoma oryzae]|nr:hypothetical protein [Spirosoma oryzae]